MTPTIDSLTIRTCHAVSAEEAAIALALSHRPTPEIIVSYSKTVVKKLCQGNHFSPGTQNTSKSSNHQVELIWTPAHIGLGVNEAVNTAAPDFTTRAGPILVPLHGAQSVRDNLFELLRNHMRTTALPADDTRLHTEEPTNADE